MHVCNTERKSSSYQYSNITWKELNFILNAAKLTKIFLKYWTIYSSTVCPIYNKFMYHETGGSCFCPFTGTYLFGNLTHFKGQYTVRMPACCSLLIQASDWRHLILNPFWGSENHLYLNYLVPIRSKLFDLPLIFCSVPA